MEAFATPDFSFAFAPTCMSSAKLNDNISIDYPVKKHTRERTDDSQTMLANGPHRIWDIA